VPTPQDGQPWTDVTAPGTGFSLATLTRIVQLGRTLDIDQYVVT